MTDLFRGYTNTEAYDFTSAGNAHTFSFNFRPDKVTFYNWTAWTGTAGKLPISVWNRNNAVASHAKQQQVLEDSGSANTFNFVDNATNGFVYTDTAPYVATSNCTISGITAANPGVVTHSAFTFETGQLVRLTELGPVGPNITSHGMDPLNNNRYMITVLSPTTFSLQDPLTGLNIDTTSFPAYVSGGRICLETHVISLNNPQVGVYTPPANPYVPNPFVYNPRTWQLLAGTQVMGSNADIFTIEVVKYGDYFSLGQLS